jgi:tetratricopeptide (TPR) repeat protein
MKRQRTTDAAAGAGRPSSVSSFVLHPSSLAFKRLLIALTVAAAFGRLGFHEFTGWDDPATIYRNPSFNPPRLANLAWYWSAWGERASMGLYVPLTYTAWGVLAKIAYLQNADPAGIRLNPFVYHSANVLLHVLAALAAFELLRRLVVNEWAACAGALLWGLHPAQVEPVGWASGTKDVLCGVLGLVALWQYVSFARDESDPTRARAMRYALATLALVGAMLAKPTAVIIPLMALVIDLFCLHRPIGRTAAALAPWFALALPIVYLARLTQTTWGIEPAPPWQRPLVAADALAFYLWKLIWPVNLAVDYGRTPARILAEGWIWYTWLAPALVALLLALYRRRAPALVAAALIFLAGVLPVLGFLPYQFQFYSTVADHYLYLSMLGPAVAMAWLADRRPRPIVLAACAAALGALGLRSVDQGKYWRDDETLFGRAIQVNPRSFVAHNNLGTELFHRGLREGRSELFDRAVRHFRASIEIFPDYPSGHENLGIALMRTGRERQAEPHLRAALRASPGAPPGLRADPAQTHTLLGDALLARGRSDEAVEQFRAALKVNPDYAPARERLELAVQRARAATTRSVTTQ